MTDFNDTVIRTVALFAGNADLTRAELVEALAKQAVGKMNAEAECDRLRRALQAFFDADNAWLSGNKNGEWATKMARARVEARILLEGDTHD